MEFKVNIELGNESMESAEHVAAALRGIADLMNEGKNSGTIKDENGNTVGRFGADEWPNPERDGLGETPTADAFIANGPYKL